MLSNGPFCFAKRPSKSVPFQLCHVKVGALLRATVYPFMWQPKVWPADCVGLYHNAGVSTHVSYQSPLSQAQSWQCWAKGSICCKNAIGSWRTLIWHRFHPHTRSLNTERAQSPPPQTLPAHCFSESLELRDQERQFGIFLKLGSWQQEQIRRVPEILVRALEKQRPQTQVLLLCIHAPAHLTDDSKGHWRKWTVM